MNRVDAAWLHMDRPENTADIVTMMMFDEPMDVASVERMVSERLLAHPRFSQRIVEKPRSGGPLWVTDPSFTPETHLSHRTLPAGDEEALRRVLSELATEPLDPSRPLWRVVSASAGDRSAVITKLHHCMGDGFALVALLFALSDEAVAERVAPRRRPTFRDLALLRTREALTAALRDPARILEAARQGVEFARSFARMSLLPVAASKVLARPLSGVRRVAWTRPIPLKGLVEAGHAAGATVNELLMASLSGALRTALLAAGETVDGLTLRALVPVNMRDDRNAAVRLLGNHFGLVFLDLPVGLASPTARLQAVRENADLVRRSPDTLVAFAVLGAFGLAPRPLERLGSDFFSRKASLVVTNVAGPKRRLHMMGHRVDRIVGWVPHPAKLGLGVSLTSYAGAVSIGVRADAAVLPDPASLALAVEAEIARYASRPARRARTVRAAPAAEAPVAS